MKTLAIILLCYFFLKYLGRILAPFLLKRFTKKMQERFNQQYQNPENQPQEEGKVTLEKTKPSTQTKSDEVGDYVDFEEVEE